MPMRKLSLLILFILFGKVNFAQPVIQLEKSSYDNLGRDMVIWEDTSKHAVINDVEKLPAQSFKQSKTEIINEGTSHKVIWCKLAFQQANNYTSYLLIDTPNIDSIDIYYRDKNGLLKHFQSGSYFPLSSRTFIATSYAFNLPDIQPGVQQLYIRLNTPNILVVPVKLVNEKTLIQFLIYKYLLEVIYIGVLLSLLFFNIFLYFSTRDKIYFYYSGYIIALCLYIVFYLRGYSHFFGNDVKDFITRYAYCFAALGNITAIAFNNSFLQVKVYFPKTIPIFKSLIFAWLGVAVLTIIGLRSLAIIGTQSLSFATPILIWIMGLIAFYNKLPFAKYYIIAWTFITASVVYFVLMLAGFFPVTDYGLQSIQIGSTLELIFLSFALGDRIRLLRKEKKEMQEENMKLITDRNLYLEEKVKERTTELRTAVNTIEASNKIKDKLFSIVAHDLRSPISNLSSALQLADNHILSNKELQPILNEIKKDVERVQTTLDNLLMWSWMQMGNQKNYKPEQVFLKQMFTDTVNMYQLLAQRKKIKIEIFCCDKVSITADREQLSLIMRNFIDNAVKFTPLNGSITIGAERNNGCYKVFVNNSGKGMDSQTIERVLTTKLTGLRSYGTANESGIGLGLQLCKEFISNMNSQLQIESSANETTTFYFEVNAS
jgi:signal transduction histidine kinase